MEGKSVEPTPEGNEPTPTIVPPQEPRKFKLRPFPIRAIISTFVTIVLIGIGKYAFISCSDAAIDAIAGKPTTRPHVPPPIVLPPEPPKIEELEETIFQQRQFAVTTRAKRHILAMKVPQEWRVEKNKTLPSMIAQMYRQERGHGFAMIVVNAMDTISSVDVWTQMTKEEVAARAARSQPGSNPTIMRYEKATLCGLHAIDGLSEYTEEGQRVRHKSVMLWADTLMLTIGIHTIGETREIDSKFYAKEFNDFVNSFTIDGDSTDFSPASAVAPAASATPQK